MLRRLRQQCTCMSNGDAHEVYASPFLFKFIEERLVFLRFPFKFYLEVEVGRSPKPTLVSRRVHVALSNGEGSGLGMLGTPLAQIKSGVTPRPWCRSMSTCVVGRIHEGR